MRNQSEITNHQNYNLIDQIINLIDTIVYDRDLSWTDFLSKDLTLLLMTCLNTLNQLLQGPCVENQKEITKNPLFINIINYFMRLDDSHKMFL